MDVELKKPFAPDTQVDESDVRMLKIALNHLGYLRQMMIRALQLCRIVLCFPVLRAR